MFNWVPHTAARSENRGAVTGTTSGTTITSGGAGDTKGSYTDIGSTTSFDYEWLLLFIGKGAGAASDDYVLDLAINVGGNRFIIAENLRYCNRKASNEQWDGYALPLHVPSGSQLSVRSQAAGATRTCEVVIIGYSSGPFGAPGYSRCRAFYTPTTSRGINCDPGAVAHTKTRTQITASTTDRAVALLVYVGPNADVAAAATRWLFDIEVGGAGAEQVLLPNMYSGRGAPYDMPVSMVFGPYPCDIPSGSRLSVNIQSHVTTDGDRDVDVALWGFVP